MGKFSVVGNAATRGINPTLKSILSTAAESMNYDVEAYSGLRPGDKRYHGQNQAVDVRLVDPVTHKIVPNYQSATSFEAYNQLANAAKIAQQRVAPDESGMRWGGYFSGEPGVYGAADLMHFDLDPKHIGMAGGSFADGLTAAQMKNFPGATSYGVGPGIANYKGTWSATPVGTGAPGKPGELGTATPDLQEGYAPTAADRVRDVAGAPLSGLMNAGNKVSETLRDILGPLISAPQQPAVSLPHPQPIGAKTPGPIGTAPLSPLQAYNPLSSFRAPAAPAPSPQGYAYDTGVGAINPAATYGGTFSSSPESSMRDVTNSPSYTGGAPMSSRQSYSPPTSYSPTQSTASSGNGGFHNTIGNSDPGNYAAGHMISNSPNSLASIGSAVSQDAFSTGLNQAAPETSFRSVTVNNPNYANAMSKYQDDVAHYQTMMNADVGVNAAMNAPTLTDPGANPFAQFDAPQRPQIAKPVRPNVPQYITKRIPVAPAIAALPALPAPINVANHPVMGAPVGNPQAGALGGLLSAFGAMNSGRYITGNGAFQTSDSKAYGHQTYGTQSYQGGDHSTLGGGDGHRAL